MGRIVTADMKAKSITFRCSASQYRRLQEHMATTDKTRTAVICEALKSFLDFADQNKQMNLFELVEAANSVGAKVKFEDEA